jgi:hypothetical protein
LIAVLGSELDEAARSLVDAWKSAGAVLLSARDLCTRGWVLHATSGNDGAFVAGGVRRPTATLRGVVVRRPAVAAEELPWIADDDRQYVATEINAFLVAWLSSLACPVLNQPTATSLCGPAWSQTYWRVAAARAGVAWADPVGPDAVEEIVFCGGLHHGAASKRQRRAASRLSAVSGAELLGVQFAGDAVAAVTLQPRLAEQGVRDLVLARLAGEVAA